ncbi:MAG: hypothetical protein EHM28_07550 [Spirochaetaceae bacterium]|nr:MAG: hypothetical protein EHM28_07550 [Spirochaetaceae bacterium]
MWTWYGWIWLASLFVGGLLALSEIISKKNKEAGELVQKLSAFQGYIGVGLIVFSVLNLIWNLSILIAAIPQIPVSAIIFIVALFAGIILGIMESIGLLKSFNIISAEVLDNISSKLMLFKVPLGIICVCASLYLAIWGIIQWQL